MPYARTVADLRAFLADKDDSLIVLSDGEGDLLDEATIDTYSDDTGPDKPCVLLRFTDE
jgi:hypothetical protein